MRRTLAQIAGITAPQRYRDGGHVRGPGTGTSDSVNIKASNGEFVLPTDTVRKVGVRRLQDLVDMTHKPSGKNQRSGRYVDGGLVDQESKRANSFGDAAAALNDSGVSQVGGSAPASPVPASTTAPAQASAPASIPSVGRSFGDAAAASKDSLVNQIPTGGLKAPAADGSQNSWSNTETGRNLSNLASALPGSVGSAIPAVVNTGGAISGGINAAARLLGGTSAGAALGAAATAPAAAQTSAAERLMNAGRGVVNPPAVNPAAPRPTVESSAAGGSIAPTTTSDVTRSGNSYSGTNVAGDITINGQAPRAGGQISAQNMTAADNLAGSQGTGARERLLSAGGGRYTGQVIPGSFTGGYSGTVGSTSTYGNMRGRSPEQRLRDAEVSASSITNRPEWGGRSAENSAAMQEFKAALQQDSNIRQNQAGADLETMRQTGSLQREGLQQSGETQRTNIRAQRDDAANQIARGRLTLEQIAAGYKNRASDRMDRAQVELESAKTPEAQRSARERLLALAGKAPQNEWGLSVTPTTKNADGSTTQGSIYRYNKTTGDTARVDAGQDALGSRVTTKAQFDALPKGSTYLGTDGRTYRKPA